MNFEPSRKLARTISILSPLDILDKSLFLHELLTTHMQIGLQVDKLQFLLDGDLLREGDSCSTCQPLSRVGRESWQPCLLIMERSSQENGQGRLGRSCSKHTRAVQWHARPTKLVSLQATPSQVHLKCFSKIAQLQLFSMFKD